MGFHVFPPSERGRGAVALHDIPVRSVGLYNNLYLNFFQEGHTLFTIPRSLVISTRTSLLPAHIGPDEWKSRQLERGWSGLILCMMYISREEGNSDSTNQGHYKT
ncbi:uncharacterized protein EV420DRAFT_577909 [Desarmillaria tabescens]|uniref:Uncharacterized protein n=1 Tax=Armillaria tabescens TaxID=1929756 RepID=A0AA39K6P5_ARMTA|nr:uncharacterized protein EV420DRAFT_577909 [Desarmillaria tabescens]KAK0455571.1 hypothetical protein EV420DRAFT_577909 [Desarmillaria tabescens]